MRLTFYLDVPPGLDETFGFKAYVRPPMPAPTEYPRYKFTIEIPDPKMYDVDLGTVPVEKAE